jgi:hypothetical protein
MSLDKFAPQSASMAGQGNQVDVAGNTDNEPIGPQIRERFPTN